MKRAGRTPTPTREPLKRLEAGLPASWFRDPVHYQRELDILWYDRWIAVAREEEILAAGDYRVAEVGSHEQLMARKGPYSELYGIQAAAYR